MTPFASESTVRRKPSVLLLVLLASLFAPTQALAWGIEWLDKLSGPGPFAGFRIDGRVVCWTARDTDTVGAARADDTIVRPAWDPTCLRDGRFRGFETNQSGVRLATDVDEMRAYISIEAAWLESAKNDMYGRLRFDPRTEVRLFSFRPALMFRAFRWVDAGVAVGLNRFSGPALTSSFHWVSVQPRVVLTPFANSRSRVARALEYRADVVYIPQRVRDELVERARRDLLDRPGSFEGGELRLMFGVDVDLFRLF